MQRSPQEQEPQEQGQGQAESAQPEVPPDLYHRDHFTVEQLATLLEISPYVIREAVRTGHLHAFVVDHHVVDIRREDVLDWLRRFPHPRGR